MISRLLDPMTRTPVVRAALRATTVGALPFALLSGQTVVQTPTQRKEFESRAELEAQEAQAEKQHRTGEAWLLKTRLEKGDFQDGDRIVVQILGNALVDPQKIIRLPDTLIVRTGKHIEVPPLPDLVLDGVLRSELASRLQEHFGRYLRDPIVRATPLVRVAVLGQVARPGYSYVGADQPLSDVIMRFGGPNGDADLENVVIKRGGEVIWTAQDTRTALADGVSIDQLHMRAGDEISVPAHRHIPWLGIVSVSGTVISLLFAIFR